MNKKTYLAFMMIACVHSFTHAQSHGNFTKSSDGKFEITYNLNGSHFDKDEKVKAALYSFKNFAWTATDIPLVKKDSFNYDGNISIPDGSSLNAIRFYQGDFQYPDMIDCNEGNGYFLSPDNIINGYYLGQLELLKNPLLIGQGLGYYSDKDNALSKEASIELLKSEFNLPNTDTVRIANAYFTYLKSIDSSNYKTVIKNKIKDWVEVKKLSDNSLSEFYYTAKGELKDDQLAVQLRNLDSINYPEGSLNRMAKYNAKMKSKTVNELILQSQTFLQQFPYNNWLKNPNGQEFIYYETYRNLAAAYFDTKQFSKFLNVTKSLNFKMLNEIYRWNILRAQFFKTINKDSLANIATVLMDNMIGKVKDGSFMSNGFFPLTYANSNTQKQLNDRIETQLVILNAVGKYTAAKKYYSFVSGSTAFNNSNLNEAYTNTLVHLKENKELDSFLKKCIYADAMTPKMMEQFKALYAKSHNSQDDFDSYYNSLKSPITIQKIHKVVKAGITSMDFEPFALESSKGGLVRSSDWDGKIVVLDFWATWCRPCIESFPSMQLLVDKYAKDPSLEFYFVGTMQSGDYKQKDSSYINNKGFRFNLLYDQLNPSSQEQNVVFSQFAKKLNSSGIPRKLIIKDGVVRYTTEGFGGSASNLLEEMSYAIELLKNEDK